MKSFKEINEARGDTAVFTFGRFNPPTTGHEKLIDALAREQGKNPGAPMYVYPSHSQNPKKDPLPHNKKVAYMKKMFPKYKRNIKVSRARNVFDIAVELHNRGHKAVVMVVGSDRVEEFDNLLNKYNGEEGRHGFYGFDDIKVVSAGERDPDADGVEGMSASKMRAAAMRNQYKNIVDARGKVIEYGFESGLPTGFADGEKLFNDVRKFMGVREEFNLTTEELNRDLYLRGEIWNVGDVVKTTDGDEGTIMRKGTNYVVFEDLRKVWLHNLEEVRKTKQDKDIEDREGTQPAKYYAKGAGGKTMKKSTKQSRARHFEKGAKMDDDNPAAYKPAPGDKGAKTKLSKYTKKYRQMYGEGKMKDISMDAELMKLYTKAMKTMPGSPAQKKIIDQINKRRKELGMKEETSESLWANIHKKRERIKRGSGEKMRKVGDKGAPTPDQMKRAKGESVIDERKLTDGEKDKLKSLEKDISKKDFIDRYGKEEGESIYYATLTKMAKKHAEEIHEMSIGKIIRDKIYNMTHPKKMDKLVKAYADAVAADTKKRHGNSFHAGEVIRRSGMEKKGVDTRQLMGYINSLVKKGDIPASLRAQDEIDEEFLDEKIEGLVKKSEKSGVPYGILKKVYDRGMAAWRTGHRPGTTPQQWAFARVNSFLTGGGARKSDADLWSKAKGAKKKKESYEIGKDYGDHTRNVTPGQKKITKESIEEWYLSESVRDKYEQRYGDEWLRKLTETYHAMLEKVSCCEECEGHFDHIVEDAEYQGRKVKLNDPIRTSENPKKKFKVYVKNEKGKVIVVRFGDPNMSINRDDPERRKSFRARHNCDDPGPKTKARYWSCFQWRAGAKVDN